ncbi:MAG: MEDS domain-containing protein [Pontiellaceae bacterium]|nr:MEDS domain-containing protein [Pontiellaceae bacterium]MBN2786405.1 MEDS domain-containing protein [Pontiellaceae bacterium]
MKKLTRNIALGFTDQPEPEGTHLCLIFSSEKERTDCLLKFLLSGLKGGERVAGFTDEISEKEICSYLEANGIACDERKQNGDITISRTSEVYFENDSFDPARMLGLLTQFYNESREQGYESARVIGEMAPRIAEVQGGERLLEYESRVTLLQRTCPLTAVCQYDANQFDGATILEVMKVHPKMLVNGSVVNNPFYIEPEEYLNSIS